MPDREKVMSWLEGLAEPDWRECYSDSEVQETARQALDLIDELLKEQEEAIPISWLESFTRLKCMDYVHGIVLDLIKTWKSVKWEWTGKK